MQSNKEILESIPPPRVALAYYRNADLYLFDECVGRLGRLRQLGQLGRLGRGAIGGARIELL